MENLNRFKIEYDKEGKAQIVDLSYVDWQGEPIKRKPTEYPYSYDAYVTFKHEEINTGKFRNMQTVYSDRMWEWNYEKFNEAHKKVWNKTGHYFGNSKPKDLEQFLRLYFEKNDIQLVGVMQGCNVSNGNHYWVFRFVGGF